MADKVDMAIYEAKWVDTRVIFDHLRDGWENMCKNNENIYRLVPNGLEYRMRREDQEKTRLVYGDA